MRQGRLEHWMRLGMAVGLLTLAACGGGGGSGDTIGSSPPPSTSPTPTPPPPPPSSADIGPLGGTLAVTSAAGLSATLTVPPGAVPASVPMAIEVVTPPSGVLAALALSPAGLTFNTPATLTVTLPASVDAAGLVGAFDMQGTVVPIGVFDATTGTMVVDLRFLALGPAAPSVTGPFGTRPTIQSARARPAASTGSGTAAQLLIQSGTLEGFVLAFENAATTFSNVGSRDNGITAEAAFDGMLNAGINRDSSGLYREMLPFANAWGAQVCSQFTFALSSLTSVSNGSAVPAFEQAVKDVLAWGRLMQDFFDLTNRLTGTRPSTSCTRPGDLIAPVRAAFPLFLDQLKQSLALLSPEADLHQIVVDRMKELVKLDATLQGASMDPEANQVAGVMSDQFRRVRQGAYDLCISQDQTAQRDLLIDAIDPIFDSIRPFGAVDLFDDIQSCAMQPRWELRDAQGALLDSGNAGGSGLAGTSTHHVHVLMGGSDKLSIQGFLVALMCPGSPPGATQTVSPHANAEQLSFSAGPVGGTRSSVGVLTSDANSHYLPNGPIDLTVAQLRTLSQPSGPGNGELVMQRIGDVCGSEFPNLTQHTPIVTFDLDFTGIAILTNAIGPTAVGRNFGATLTARGGVLPLAWAASGLPAGLSLNPATGVISGQAAAIGASTVTITATGADGTRVSKTLTLQVTSASALAVGSLSMPFATLGAPYATTLTASGGVPPYTWSASGLAAGLSIDPGTGVVSGTPTQIGAFTPTVSVRSSDGQSLSRSGALSVITDVSGTYIGDVSRFVDPDGTGLRASQHIEHMVMVVTQTGQEVVAEISGTLISTEPPGSRLFVPGDSAHSLRLQGTLNGGGLTNLRITNLDAACPGSFVANGSRGQSFNMSAPTPFFALSLREIDCHQTSALPTAVEVFDGTLFK